MTGVPPGAHLSRYHDGQKVWLGGVRLDGAGLPVESMQVLVPAAVLARYCSPADG